MSDRLNPNDQLALGQSIVSQDGRFTVVMQGDGNLVMYGPVGARWATNTAGRPASRAIMQGDGNLVVYAADGHTPLWASNTNGQPGAWLVMQSDGNLVIYNLQGRTIWASNTNILSNSVPNFRPSTAGLHFPNNYPKGTPYPILTLPIVGAINAGDAGNGLCGGFTFTALDLFFHNPRIAPPPSTTRPDPNSPQFNYLVGRLIDSFGTSPVLDNVAKCIQWIQTPSHDVTVSLYGPGLGNRMVTDEWTKIKADIDAGKPSPLYLVMEPECGPADIPGIIVALGHGHQVAAYAYTLDHYVLTLSIYDCNDPNDDNSTIVLNISDPAHTIAITAAAVEANIIDPSAIRGFFRSDYTPKDPGTTWDVPPISLGGPPIRLPIFPVRPR